MQNYKPKAHQSGAALIVALVTLSAMTVLGFTSISNTDIQSAVQKNTQFLLLARNAAMTEINGQLGDINNNLDSEDDPVIQELLDAGLDKEYVVADSEQEDKKDELIGPATAFERSVTMTMKCEDKCTVPGFSLGAGQAGFAAMVAELRSSAELGDTAAKSNQIVGYWYLIPASN